MPGNTVVDVSENDVLLGRGKRSNNWPGNIRFRKLVDARQNAYITASDDVTRDAIAFEIANSIERQGGRFLRETVMDVDGAPRSAWVVVEGATIRTKVKQALRDSAKAKPRESADREESAGGSGDQEADRKAVASRSPGRRDWDSSIGKAGAKRSSITESRQQPHEDIHQQDRKRPAVTNRTPAISTNVDPRHGSGVDFAAMQRFLPFQDQQAPWGFPSRANQPPPQFLGGFTAEQQLRSAIEREQQLSLLRTLTMGQNQQLRLEEERRALAAALNLRRAAGLLPTATEQLPFLNPSMGASASTFNILDQLRRINEPTPSDTLAAFRLRQSLLDPSLTGQPLLPGQLDLLGSQRQLQQALQLQSRQSSDSGLGGPEPAPARLDPSMTTKSDISHQQPSTVPTDRKLSSVQQKESADEQDSESSEEDPEYEPEDEP